MRTFGKTAILLLMVVILGSLIAGAISVRGAVTNTDVNLRRTMPAIVTVAFDHEAWSATIDWDAVDWNDHATVPRSEFLTLTQLQNLEELSYVSSVDYSMGFSMGSRELENFWWRGHEAWELKYFNLIGALSADMIQFDQGMMTLAQGQGRQFEESELIAPGSDAENSVAIISVELANQNNLSVGSTVELYELILFPPEDGYTFWGPEVLADDNIYKQIGMAFEIIGLFEMPLELEQGVDENIPEYLVEHLNSIFVPAWVIEELSTSIAMAHESVWDAVDFERPAWSISDFEEDFTEMAPVAFFVLADPIDIEGFKVAAEPYLPSEFHYIADLSTRFDDISASMGMLQDIFDWILYGSLVATVVILSLLITLFLRDRRHEMGVYLALGEKKRSIVSQILLEVVVTSFVGITLALFAGHFISNTVSQSMLRNELTVLAKQNDEPWSWENWTPFDSIAMQTSPMTPDEMMEAFDVSLSASTVGLFYVVGLGTVLFSTVIPVWYVVKLSPKKVLL